RLGKEVLWSVQAPSAPSTIRPVRLAVKDVDTVESAWATESSSNPGALNIWVQWRQMGGNEWSSLQVNLKGSEAMLDVSGLPRVRPVVFRFLLNDGFDTAAADSDPVQLPPRPPLAAIVQPQAETMRPGQMVKLQADGVSFKGEALAAEAFRWLLDGQVVA